MQLPQRHIFLLAYALVLIDILIRRAPFYLIYKVSPHWPHKHPKMEQP